MTTTPYSYAAALDFLKHHGPVLQEAEGRAMVRLTTSIRAHKSTDNAVVALTIPAGTLVHIGEQTDSETSVRYKCRAEKVRVRSITSKRTGRPLKSTLSHRDHYFKYTPRKTATPSFFDGELRMCSGGIHCFLDEQSAANYLFD